MRISSLFGLATGVFITAAAVSFGMSIAEEQANIAFVDGVVEGNILVGAAVCGVMFIITRAFERVNVRRRQRAIRLGQYDQSCAVKNWPEGHSGVRR